MLLWLATCFSSMREALHLHSACTEGVDGTENRRRMAYVWASGLYWLCVTMSEPTVNELEKAEALQKSDCLNELLRVLQMQIRTAYLSCVRLAQYTSIRYVVRR